MNDPSLPARRRVIAYLGALLAAGLLGPGGARAQAPDPEAKDPAEEWKAEEGEGKKEIERTDLPEDLRRLTTRDKKPQVKQKEREKVKLKKVERKKVKRKKVRQKKVE